MTKKQKNAIDDRIQAIYRARCSGIQIDVMDIGKIFDKGYEVIATGANDQVLGDAIAAFVETIRQN